ncbi:uncharacterized protein SCALIN_C06_0005 [Candidatus Scalindua japonica]|uniref:tRNA-uridine aminocarboxypropyltransferase n=2 Tax=Candidatus Scalindua japonica TaxID=1284222 RepID=A0A286TWC9_9BACT|nr:uncharacterized protein SCALIN_C06_0005 [Candidatus Scalindua japonica]
MLENNALIYIGENGWEKKIEDEITRSKYTPVIFFPTSPDGQSVVEEMGKPLNIIVFDTNWSSARRWFYKLGAMKVKKIGLRKVPPSKYYLRKQSKKENLCTFQAVTSLLEELGTGSPGSPFTRMNEIFALWVKSLARERGLTIP